MIQLESSSTSYILNLWFVQVNALARVVNYTRSLFLCGVFACKCLRHTKHALVNKCDRDSQPEMLKAIQKLILQHLWKKLQRETTLDD